MNSLLRGVGLSLALLLFGSTAAQADPVLFIDDISTVGIDVLVFDEALAGTVIPGFPTVDPTTHTDSLLGPGLEGYVGFSGLVGNFGVSVSTGISKPVLGPNPTIHLDSVNVTSSGAGTIIIGLADIDFTTPGLVSGGLLELGGVTDGTIEFAAGIDDGNGFFTSFPDYLTPDTDPFGPGSYSGDFTWNENIAGGVPFSMYVQARIIHTAARQTTSFDAEVTATPEPGSIALCGLALAGFAVYRRRRNKA